MEASLAAGLPLPHSLESQMCMLRLLRQSLGIGSPEALPLVSYSLQDGPQARLSECTLLKLVLGRRQEETS